MSSVDTAALILRLSLGAVVLAHGVNPALGQRQTRQHGGLVTSIGLRQGKLHAVLATATEIAAGLLLIVGLLTPFAAAAVVSTMTVALITAHLRNGFFIFPVQGGNSPPSLPRRPWRPPRSDPDVGRQTAFSASNSTAWQP
ncbi:DoxX family protein [Nocardia salmonicida]|uniref:DoxX family protein n=1 Tax=Nocardia salmonicida TaxID=53431 RepID=UPI00371DF2C8